MIGSEGEEDKDPNWGVEPDPSDWSGSTETDDTALVPRGFGISDGSIVERDDVGGIGAGRVGNTATAFCLSSNFDSSGSGTLFRRAPGGGSANPVIGA